MNLSVQRGIKRAIDIAVSGAALLAAWPVLAGIAAAIRITMGKPVFFRQPRPGRGGRIFRMWKFRSMRNLEDCPPGVDGVQRITPLGKILRATSLDELPELINVLVGDMSLVGPRPLLVKYLDRFTPEEARRHEVRGITGLAQVSGRNAQSWEERLATDVRYVDEWSLALDWKILVKTVKTVLAREGVNAGAATTMTEFRPQ